MASKIKLKPNGTPPYMDGKGEIHYPNSILMEAMGRYIRFAHKAGGFLFRVEEKPLQSKYGYYKGKSYFPGYVALRRNKE